MGGGRAERRVALERTATPLVVNCEQGVWAERPDVGGAVQASCPHLRCPWAVLGTLGHGLSPEWLRGTPEAPSQRSVSRRGHRSLAAPVPTAKPWLSQDGSRSQPGPGRAGVRTKAPCRGVLVEPGPQKG